MGQLEIFRVAVPSGRVLERGDSRAIVRKWSRNVCPWILRVAHENMREPALR